MCSSGQRRRWSQGQSCCCSCSQLLLVINVVDVICDIIVRVPNLLRRGATFLDYADTAEAAFLEAGGVWASKVVLGIIIIIRTFLEHGTMWVIIIVGQQGGPWHHHHQNIHGTWYNLDNHHCGHYCGPWHDHHQYNHGTWYNLDDHQGGSARWSLAWSSSKELWNNLDHAGPTKCSPFSWSNKNLDCAITAANILPPHIVGWTFLLLFLLFFSQATFIRRLLNIFLCMSQVFFIIILKKMLKFYKKKCSHCHRKQNIMNYLFLSQIGSNAVYILFVAQNILPVRLGRHLIPDDDCTTSFVNIFYLTQSLPW